MDYPGCVVARSTHLARNFSYASLNSAIVFLTGSKSYHLSSGIPLRPSSCALDKTPTRTSSPEIAFVASYPRTKSSMLINRLTSCGSGGEFAAFLNEFRSKVFSLGVELNCSGVIRKLGVAHTRSTQCVVRIFRDSFGCREHIHRIKDIDCVSPTHLVLSLEPNHPPTVILPLIEDPIDSP